jgi:hypothetical protein
MSNEVEYHVFTDAEMLERVKTTLSDIYRVTTDAKAAIVSAYAIAQIDTHQQHQKGSLPHSKPLR